MSDFELEHTEAGEDGSYFAHVPFNTDTELSYSDLWSSISLFHATTLRLLKISKMLIVKCFLNNVLAQNSGTLLDSAKDSGYNDN